MAVERVEARVLKGFRDYLPSTMLPKQRMLDCIARVFESFGFAPLATPALEYADILVGKYGDEGDALLYRFRDNGDRDVAMRYDLTVPLARVIGQHRQLPRPFKRYQIAPVWRAEKPGRGRFREFSQCDVDIVGAAELTADAECLEVAVAVLDALGVERYELRVNNRKVLTGLFDVLGLHGEDATRAILRTIDKLPKIGEGACRQMLAEVNHLGADPIDRIFAFLKLAPSSLQAFLEGSPAGQAGAAELALLLGIADQMGIADRIAVDLSIARGLDYYTGTIYETFLTDLESLGSVMSGGRYDGLMSMFSGQDVPAVGISLGVDRLFVGLQALGAIKEEQSPTRVLVTVFCAEARRHAYEVARALREAGHPTEVFLGDRKLKKQLQYADTRQIPYVVVCGPEEREKGEITLKNLRNGETSRVSLTELPSRVPRP